MFEVLSGCNVIGHGIFGSMASNSEPPQPPNYDNIEMEGIGSLTLPNSLKAPFERLELSGNSKQEGHKINISSAELEQGTLSASNGTNYPSNYRVRTKDYMDLEKGAYKITCDGAKQGNLVEYDMNGTWKKTWFDAHAPFPWIANFTENCKIRIILSNGTEAEQILIKPSDVKSITLQAEVTLEYPQEIVSCGKLNADTGKYEVDVQVSGRNLIDIDALRNENGYMSGNYEKSRDIDHFNIVKGKRYLLITKGKPLVAGDYSSVYFGDETVKYGVNNGDWLGTPTGYVSFTSNLKQNRSILTAKKTATITKMILHGKANTRKDDYDVEEFGLFEMLDDKIDFPYEPYREPQTLQLQLNEPLRGIGEYRDVITKDGIVRNIAECKLADYLQKNIYGESGKKYIFSEVPNCYINYDRNRCISSVGFATNGEDITYVPVPYLNNFKLCVQDEDTVETIREKVKDVIVAFTVKEPILEPFENSLDSLHANDGTTIITVDAGEVKTGIKLTYRKGK